MKTCSSLLIIAALANCLVGRSLSDGNSIIPNVHDQQPYQSGIVNMDQGKQNSFIDSLEKWIEKKLVHKLEMMLKEGKNGLRDILDCDFCKAGVDMVKTAINIGFSRKQIVSMADILCETKFDSRICAGIVSEFQEEFFSVIENMTLSPAELCSIVFGGSTCSAPYDPKIDWHVTLPKQSKPPVKPILPPDPKSPRLKVLQISDIHFDPYYSEGANANCSEPLCCRKNSGKVGRGAAAGKWGDYRNCDTPLNTLDNLMEHLSPQKFDYILWTGDLPPHDVWNQTQEGQLTLIKTLTNMLLKYFKDTPIFPALGNHESSPVDSFPPPTIKGRDSITWLYDALASNWSHWLPKETISNIKYGAYYTVLITPGFRIISINTNYCNNMNWWLLLNTTDPAEELKWLIDVLLQAEINKEKVHIIGHIPPGITDCLKTWSWNYHKIINRFESTITAQFFGHTHRDHLEIFYDEVQNSRPVSIAYIGPSVTPFPDMNLGYRVYDIDGFYKDSSFVVLDHETYILNLTEANHSGKAIWQKEYSAKSAYGLDSLLPADWDRLIHNMTINDQLMQSYYRYYYKSHPPSLKCDASCKKTLLCEIKTSSSYDTSHCEK